MIISNMQNTYFHSDVSRYRKRMKFILAIILLPSVFGSIVITLTLLVNFRIFINSGFPKPALYYIASAVFFSVLSCWFVIEKTNKSVTRNARYTFFDIGERELVCSRYAGEYIRSGQRIILRRLDVISIENLDLIKINLKNGKLLFISKNGGIRSYTARNEHLGYHFVKGKLEFDEWWYNVHCYETCTELVIPNIFGNARELGLSVEEARERFKLIPKRKEYVHKELDFVKRKKIINALKKSDKY